MPRLRDNGIIRANPGEKPEIIKPVEVRVNENNGRGNVCEYFVDGREGTDRWGTPYKDKQACGSGWGEDEYVCPLYVEEACPGCKNKGNRVHPCYQQSCDLHCGKCGGGGDGLSYTMGYCGQEKGLAFRDSMYGEHGGKTLRLDGRSAPAPSGEHPFDWNLSYYPGVEWGGRQWMKQLQNPEQLEAWGLNPDPYPMIGTTMKTVFPGLDGRRVTPLRDRLGGFEGHLCVNGLTKDDLLDDVWEKRDKILRFCMDSGVNTMITPEYSAYPEYMNGMMVFNAGRTMRWYEMCMEAGFEQVVMDIPASFHARWILDEYFAFVERAKVKCISLSYQQFRARGGMDPRTMWNMRTVHESIPMDVAVMIFGPSTPQRIMTVCQMMKGRKIIFSTMECYARSAFYQLLPFGSSAPAGMEKDEVFCRNVHNMRAQTDLVMRKFNPDLERGLRPAAPKKKSREELDRIKEKKRVKRERKKVEREEMRARGEKPKPKLGRAAKRAQDQQKWMDK